MHERIPIRIYWLWRPLFALFGATRSRSYVELTPDRVVAKLGSFQITVPRANIASCESTSLPWWWGRGWRTNLKDSLALVGVGNPVLKLSLVEQQRSRLLLIPIRVRSLYVSVEDVPRALQLLQRTFGTP